MFEFSRDLKRFLVTDGPRDGLTGGDMSLLELLDLNLLRAEAKAGDIAAGRVSARDPSQRRLDAARIWRELARRTGDVAALRRAAESAEKAADAFKREGRMRGWAYARVEQAEAALLGADLYGDEGLIAAAEIALGEARKAAPATTPSAIAWARQVRLHARHVVTSVESREGALALAAGFDAPVTALEQRLRARAVGKAEVINVICDKAEVLIALAARMKDAGLYEEAIKVLDKAAARIDPTYEPLTWQRLRELRGAARSATGELHAQIEDILSGIDVLVDAVDAAGADHSPLDWARLHQSLAIALQAMGEASDADRAFEHALGAYDRALWATKDTPHLSLRAALAHNRAGCLARRAEMAADVGMLDEAVDVLKRELAALPPSKDPVGWAVAQVNLARLYEARSALPGKRRDERGAAAVALNAALDVFAEHGLRSLSDQAVQGLERLTAPPPQRAAFG